MRSLVRAMLVALAINPFVAEPAFCQPDEFEPFEFQEDDIPPPQQQRKKVDRTRNTWRNNPITWGISAVVLAVAIPLGVVKIAAQMRGWQKQQERPKQQWEIAMENAERERERGKHN